MCLFVSASDHDVSTIYITSTMMFLNFYQDLAYCKFHSPRKPSILSRLGVVERKSFLQPQVIDTSWPWTLPLSVVATQPASFLLFPGRFAAGSL